MPDTVELVGVYDDGGLRGEAAYVVGHLLGRRHCALCDLTHSQVRRKPAWDAMVGRLGLPLRLVHRNELAPAERAVVDGTGAPVVLLASGEGLRLLLDRTALDSAGGDLGRFETLLRAALEGR